MIFKFGKGRKLSDLTKLAEFLEKENIEYEMLTDVQLQVGPAPVVTTTVQPNPVILDPEDAVLKARREAAAKENDPLWQPSPSCGHCEGLGKLDNGDKCLKPAHYGGSVDWVA